jgi:integrase
MRAAILTEYQFDSVFAYIETIKRPEMYRLMLLLTKRLGLRPVELANMETSWWDMLELRIPQGSSKRKGCRSLPLNEELHQALRAHMGNKSGRVFRNAAGEAMTADAISMAMRRLYKMAGIKGSAYSGRRTAATNMVDSGVNIRIIQDFLGHSNLATTAAYCETTPAMLRRAVFG